MADDLCGPANPVKSFRDHVGRDNSLHQDRSAGAPQNYQSFRSSTGSSSNAEFNSFINASNEPLQPIQSPFNIGPVPAPQSIQHSFQLPNGNHDLIPQTHSWVNQFSTMSIARNGSPASAAQVLAPVAAPNYAPGGYLHHPMAPTFAPTAPSFGQSYTPMPFAQMPHETYNLPAVQTQPFLSEAALEARFAEFQAEEDEAESEMNKWMLQNKTRHQSVDLDVSDGLRGSDSQQTEPSLERDEAERMLDDPHNADDSKQAMERQQEAERLRQIAGAIVNTTHGSNGVTMGVPEKFRNSSFIALMARIHRGDVILNDNHTDLIDTKTGLSADQTHIDDSTAGNAV